MINHHLKSTILSLLEHGEFKALCDNHFSSHFCWEIKGSSMLSGIYKDKKAFLEKVIMRLSRVIEHGWKMHILGTYIDGDTMIVEMRGKAQTKNGGHYNNEYCWIFHFRDNRIVHLTAYYDSLLVNQTLTDQTREIGADF